MAPSCTSQDRSSELVNLQFPTSPNGMEATGLRLAVAFVGGLVTEAGGMPMQSMAAWHRIQPTRSVVRQVCGTGLYAYPNPTTGAVRLSLGSTVRANVTVECFDQIGSCYYRKSVTRDAISNELEIADDVLHHGPTWVRLVDANGIARSIVLVRE
jgi:hypothetical protein